MKLCVLKVVEYKENLGCVWWKLCVIYPAPDEPPPTDPNISSSPWSSTSLPAAPQLQSTAMHLPSPQQLNEDIPFENG